MSLLTLRDKFEEFAQGVRVSQIEPGAVAVRRNTCAAFRLGSRLVKAAEGFVDYVGSLPQRAALPALIRTASPAIAETVLL
jgi:hypothetical protein